MGKRVKTFEELEINDIVELYTWSEGSYVIEKQRFRVSEGIRGNVLTLTKIDKNNKTIYDYWGDATAYYMDKYMVKQNHFGYLYLDPKEIGAKAIEVAKKKKAQINKRIMEVQRLMYSVE